MGKNLFKSSKPSPSSKLSKSTESSTIKEKKYFNDPVFGPMVYNEIVGAWVPAYNEDLYEQSHLSYLKEKEENKKNLKIFNINSESIKNFYEDMPEHKSFSIIKKIPIKLGTYNYVYFLKDGRLAVNTSSKLDIYSKDIETIEQTINNDTIFITQLEDNRLVNCKYNAANIYKYDQEKKEFIFDCSLKCINNAEKVVELPNEKLALLADNIHIFSKENEKYIEDGKCLSITTIDDFILINENEIASISGQESEITFWDLTTRKIILQIGEIKNYGRFCLILFGKSLIVGGASRYDNTIFIYIINIDNHELIKKYHFSHNIWFMTKLNEKEFITGQTEGIINRYRFEENELKLMEKNEEHKNETVMKLSFDSNGNRLASLSENSLIIFKISE